LIIDEGHEMAANKHLLKKSSTSSNAAHRGSSTPGNPGITPNGTGVSDSNSSVMSYREKNSLRKKWMMSNEETFLPSTFFICGIAAERR
jgi:hypothetical protein